MLAQIILILLLLVLLLVCAILLYRQYYLKKKLLKIFPEVKSASLDQISDQLLARNAVHNFEASGRDLKDHLQLSSALRELASLAFEQFNKYQKIVSCVEIELFAQSEAITHSSCIVGVPSGNTHRNFLKQDITFSGESFGAVKVSFTEAHIISAFDRSLLELLIKQIAIAILNVRYSDELLKMQQLGEESLRARTGFLANLSHEIRGPLGIILNAAEILLKGLCGELQEQQVKTLSMVQKNGEHLLELVNDVLDYARVSSGKFETDPEQINLRELLDEMYKLVQTQASSKEQTLKVELCPEDWFIMGDRRHLRQMLINLLTNAVKYTERGGCIEFYAEAVKDYYRIIVKDNGIGISAEDAQRLFNAFERMSHDYAQKQSGTGLGLSLVKQLAEANSAIVAYQPWSEGSMFWLQFRQMDADQIQPVSSESPQFILDDRHKDSKMLLLLPDGAESDLLQDYLNNLGFTITYQNFEKDQQVSFDASQYQMIILDAKFCTPLEEFDINKIKQGSNVPIVLITSDVFNYNIQDYLAVGVDICISRPYALESFRDAVIQAIDS